MSGTSCTWGVAVKALDTAGGPQTVQANGWFRVEGQPIVVVGDLVAAHGVPPHSPPPAMVEGTTGFRVGLAPGGGRPVCRAGHLAACGHATTGRGWFRIW